MITLQINTALGKRSIDHVASAAEVPVVYIFVPDETAMFNVTHFKAQYVCLYRPDIR